MTYIGLEKDLRIILRWNNGRWVNRMREWRWNSISLFEGEKKSRKNKDWKTNEERNKYQLKERDYYKRREMRIEKEKMPTT